jgi:hypothetical protein
VDNFVGNFCFRAAKPRKYEVSSYLLKNCSEKNQCIQWVTNTPLSSMPCSLMKEGVSTFCE